MGWIDCANQSEASRRSTCTEGRVDARPISLTSPATALPTAPIAETPKSVTAKQEGSRSSPSISTECSSCNAADICLWIKQITHLIRHCFRGHRFPPQSFHNPFLLLFTFNFLGCFFESWHRVVIPQPQRICQFLKSASRFQNALSFCCLDFINSAPLCSTIFGACDG